MLTLGALSKVLILQTYTETVAGGDVVRVYDSGVTIRASVTMLDGSLFINDAELVGKTIYKIQFFDNNYSQNIRLLYGDMVLYPVKPLTKNPGTSYMTEVTVLTATKSGEVSPISADDHIYSLYDTTELVESSFLDEI